MGSIFVKGVAFGAIACVVAMSWSAALAGTGVGAVFNLGTTNTANSSTLLQGTTRGQQLRVVNNGDAVPFAGTVKGDQLFTIQAGKPGHTATITTAGHWTPAGCVFDAQAVLQ